MIEDKTFYAANNNASIEDVLTDAARRGWRLDFISPASNGEVSLYCSRRTNLYSDTDVTQAMISNA